MSIEVRIPTILRQYTDGSKAVEGAGGTLEELLEDLESRHAGLRARLVDDNGLRRFVNVYLNDEDVRFLGGLQTELKDGDSVSLSGKFTVTITDDVPHADIDLRGGSVTVDETPGNQADDTTSSSVRNLFAALEATFVSPGVRLVGDERLGARRRLVRRVRGPGVVALELLHLAARAVVHVAGRVDRRRPVPAHPPHRGGDQVRPPLDRR